MDNLPIEVLTKILCFLPLQEKLKCREISKKFQSIIDSYHNKQLVIGSEVGFSRWFDDLKEIDTRNKILHKNNIQRFERFNYFGSRFFAGVKKLHIDLSIDTKYPKILFNVVDLTFLNNFIQLQTLFMHCIALSHNLVRFDNNNYKVTKLHLPNLENLDIFLVSRHIRIHFYAPRLRVVNSGDFDLLKFEYPESVKQMNSSLLDSNYSSIIKFRNLQSLRFTIEKGHVDLLISIIKNLPMLEELDLNLFDTDPSDLFNYSKKRDLLRIYIHGILLKYWVELPEYYRSGKFNGILNRGNLEVYLKHYSSVYRRLDFLNDVDYNVWEEEWFKNRQLIESFRSKIRLISGIQVKGKIKSFDYLMSFIRQNNSISRLELIYTSFDQKFYSELVNYLPLINRLNIEDKPDVLEKLDFNFLSRLECLILFKINYPINLECIKKLFLMENSYAVKFVRAHEEVTIKRCIDLRGQNQKPSGQRNDVELDLFLINLAEQCEKKFNTDITFEVIYS